MAIRRHRTSFAEPDADARLEAAIAACATPLHGWEDLDPLLERIGNAHYVLLGEATPA
jgi:hypothetical protein